MEKFITNPVLSVATKSKLKEVQMNIMINETDAALNVINYSSLLRNLFKLKQCGHWFHEKLRERLLF